LFYPSGFSMHRSGTLTAHPKSPYVVGNFALTPNAYLMAFQTSDTGTLTNSSLLQLPVAQCAFRFEMSDGKYLLVFMPNGNLMAYTYDKATSWKMLAQVTVVPGMTACSQGLFTPGHQQAFVMVYATQTLYSVDLENVMKGIMTVSTTSLPFMPFSAVVAAAPAKYSCGGAALNNNATAPSTPMAPVKAPAAPVAPVPAPVAPVPAPVAPVPVRVPPTPVRVPTPVAPVPTTVAPVPVPVPVSPPEGEEDVSCGMFGLSIFCPRSGECGFFRRLFNMGGCE
jgi:hypothetical protein